MQSNRQPLKEEVPKFMDVEAVKSDLHEEDTIQVGHIYIYCQRNQCRTWRKMDKARPCTTEDENYHRWIGVKIYEAYDPSQGKEILMTESKKDTVAKYYCSRQCYVIGEL